MSGEWCSKCGHFFNLKRETPIFSTSYGWICQECAHVDIRHGKPKISRRKPQIKPM